MINKVKSLPFRLAVLIGGAWALLAIPNSERVGDRLQFALPIAAMVCSFEIKDAPAAIGRFALGWVTVHGLKNGLPAEGIALRPDGGSHGFPSGHTYAATFGASYIAYQCAEKIPYIGPVVAIAAGTTAASRVEAGKHSVMQVFWGAVFAIFFERGVLLIWQRYKRRRAQKAERNP